MPNTAQLVFKDEDQSFSVASILQGIAAVSVQTLRGPYGPSDDVFYSWAEFSRVYGGEVASLDGPTLVKRALERGAALRINKVGHYTTISDPSSLDAVVSDPDETGSNLGDNGTAEALFDVKSKYPGADYNNIVVQITDASSGDTDQFDVIVSHANDTRLTETYKNLEIIGQPTVAESNYLDVIKNNSMLIDITYLDLSALVGTMRPQNGTWSFENGSNGTTPVAADYVGDSGGGTGFYAFDNFDDFELVAALDLDDNSILTGGAAYAAGRKDCFFVGHLPLTNTTVATLQSARDTTAVDSQYTFFFSGGVKIVDPFDSSITKNISELGDVIGAAMKSSKEFGPWYSFAGSNRGQIYNALGVVNNFGAGGAGIDNLNLLANRQINMVINRNGQILISGNFTAQISQSRRSYINVARLVVYIRKSLQPTLERYLEEPNDFANFRKIYGEVVPFLEDLKGEDKRALLDYEWKGDQFANTDADLKINTRTELDQGKYTIELWMKEIVSLQEFTIKLISAPSGVEFEDNINV